MNHVEAFLGLKPTDLVFKYKNINNLKGNCTVADFRYGDQDIISTSILIFAPIKG